MDELNIFFFFFFFFKLPLELVLFSIGIETFDNSKGFTE